MSWRTPITLVVLLGVLMAAAFYGWQTIISPARESKDKADPAPVCEKTEEFQKGQVIKSKDITVNVYNAGVIAGLAGDTLTRLDNRGFATGTADNAPDGVKATNVTIITSDKKSPAVQLVAVQFKGPVKFSDQEDLTPGVDIIVGEDFKGIDVSAPKSIRIKKDVSTCASTKPKG